MLSSALAQQGLEILTASDPEAGLDLIHRPASANRADRSGDAAHERPGSAGTDHGVRSVHRRDPDDRALLHRIGGGGDQEGRVGLPEQAGFDRRAARADRQAGRRRARRQRALQLEDEMLASAEFEGIVGRSPLMWEMFSQIRRVAPHYRAMLITGRNRHRQGSGRAGAAQAEPGVGGALRGAELLGRGRDACLRANCSAM